MAENSKIEWTHHTFNPWWGCVKVSPACDNCYAEAFSRRFGDHWGPKAQYRTFSDKHWDEPLKWSSAAEKVGERHRVFCASKADVFDNRAPEGTRERLWALIRTTPGLDWLLLTKRPQNIAKMLPIDWNSGYPNVWLGATVENQGEAERRIPAIISIPAAIRFLSCEPLLEAVNLRQLKVSDDGLYLDALTGHHEGGIDHIPLPPAARPIDWVICGGESGPRAREMDPDWARQLRDQCKIVSSFFMKQMAHKAPIPGDLLIRQFPATKTDSMAVV